MYIQLPNKAYSWRILDRDELFWPQFLILVYICCIVQYPKKLRTELTEGMNLYTFFC